MYNNFICRRIVMFHLKTIFFDIDDTFYSTTEFTQFARMNAIRAMIKAGLKVDEITCLKELEAVAFEFGSNYDQHYNELIKRLDIKLDINESIIIAAGMVAYHDTKMRGLIPFYDVEWALSILSRNPKLKLGVISDGLTIKQIEKLIRLNVIQYLDKRAIFISEELGIKKPDSLLFTHCCEKMKIDPHETMYVGDNPHNDIDPANKAGMISVLYLRGGKHTYQPGKTEPTEVIYDMTDLIYLLKDKYKMPLTPP